MENEQLDQKNENFAPKYNHLKEIFLILIAIAAILVITFALKKYFVFNNSAWNEAPSYETEKKPESSNIINLDEQTKITPTQKTKVLGDLANVDKILVGLISAEDKTAYVKGKCISFNGETVEVQIFPIDRNFVLPTEYYIKTPWVSDGYGRVTILAEVYLSKIGELSKLQGVGYIGLPECGVPSN